VISSVTCFRRASRGVDQLNLPNKLQLNERTLGLSHYRIIYRTVSRASNPFLPFLLCQEMVLYKRMVLYLPYKKVKNCRFCAKFMNLDLGCRKGDPILWVGIVRQIIRYLFR
jgi:hypothetical protein